MKLTRRDAVVALTGAATLELGAGVLGRDGDEAPLSAAERERLLAVTDVVYPSAVSVDESFLETYVTGRYSEADGDRERVRAALAHVEDVARDQFGASFAALPVDDREAVLRRIGVDRVASLPEGRLPERVRYYVVNDLLFALYSTPVGGKLLGQENPTGYPGGLEAYQRGPDA